MLINQLASIDRTYNDDDESIVNFTIPYKTQASIDDYWQHSKMKKFEVSSDQQHKTNKQWHSLALWLTGHKHTGAIFK